MQNVAVPFNPVPEFCMETPAFAKMPPDRWYIHSAWLIQSYGDGVIAEQPGAIVPFSRPEITAPLPAPVFSFLFFSSPVTYHIHHRRSKRIQFVRSHFVSRALRASSFLRGEFSVQAPRRFDNSVLIREQFARGIYTQRETRKYPRGYRAYVIGRRKRRGVCIYLLLVLYLARMHLLTVAHVVIFFRCIVRKGWFLFLFFSFFFLFSCV